LRSNLGLCNYGEIRQSHLAKPIDPVPGKFEKWLSANLDLNKNESRAISLLPWGPSNVAAFLWQTPQIGDPIDPETQKNPWLEVVGVVASTKSTRYNQIAWESRPEVYTDYRQQQFHQAAESSDITKMTFVVRTRPGVILSDASIQRAVWSEDPNLPVGQIKSLGEMVAELQTQPRVRARLLTVFAGLTLLLAAIGIYGVMAQSVAQRYREIGIRMALGADRNNVLRLVLKQGLGLTLFGVVLGTILGLVAVRFMKSLLYGINANSPATYLGVIAVVCFVSLIASFLPARRAATVDPVRSLRIE
jgi:putative ABC transport system permease protein